MGRPFSLGWWPFLAVTAPVWAPILATRQRAFRRDEESAKAQNAARIAAAHALDLPELDSIEIRVLADWRAREGFRGEAGVSCLFQTSQGSLLFDVAFGDETGAVAHNAVRMGVTSGDIGAVAISHLHNDHMGGTRAFRSNAVAFPASLRPSGPARCFLPAPGTAEGFDVQVVSEPRMLSAGIASTGPLARRLFMLGWVEEQALVLRLKGKGLVVFTGCGHQTLPTLLQMVRKISVEPIYAIGGGFHLPLTEGRLKRCGIDLQTILGTGKMPWSPINLDDVETTLAAIRSAEPKRLFLSAHDTGDEALRRLATAADCETTVIEAGASYRI